MNGIWKWVVGLGAVFGAVYLLTKKGVAPSGEITPGGVIAWSGITGPLIEGSTGNIAGVTVKNTSVYAGTTTKAPARLYVVVNVDVGITPLLRQASEIDFAAGETKTLDYTFAIPSGKSGAAVGIASLGYIPTGTILQGNVTRDFTISPAAGATVNVTLRARNAPANAVYWMAMCATYQESDLIPIANPIAWNNIPANTSQTWVIFGCYNASQQPISTPNAWSGIGFSTPFVNGKTYYWDFATGILLDEYFNWM